MFSGKVRRNAGLDHAENQKQVRRFISFILQKAELLSASEHGCVPVFAQQSADLGTCDDIHLGIVFETVHYQTLHKHDVMSVCT